MAEIFYNEFLKKKISFGQKIYSKIVSRLLHAKAKQNSLAKVETINIKLKTKLQDMFSVLYDMWFGIQ